MCLAFFAFLQDGEITAPRRWQFDPHRHPTPGDITMSDSDNCLQFRLKCSKTDQLYKRHTIILHMTPYKLCPVRMIKEYVDHYSTSQTQPLFTHCDGRLRSLQQFRQRLKHLFDLAGLPSKRYNMHSLRIGAMTSAAREGVSAKRIKQLRSWQSQAYLLYIHWQTSTLEHELHAHTMLTCSLDSTHHTWFTIMHTCYIGHITVSHITTIRYAYIAFLRPHLMYL